MCMCVYMCVCVFSASELGSFSIFALLHTYLSLGCYAIQL